MSRSEKSKAGLIKKLGRPFKGNIRDTDYEINIKEKRGIFRSFKFFYKKGLHLYSQNELKDRSLITQTNLSRMP